MGAGNRAEELGVMRSRTTVCVAVTMVIPAGVALAACGGEDIAERIAENRIEAEGGGDDFEGLARGRNVAHSFIGHRKKEVKAGLGLT